MALGCAINDVLDFGGHFLSLRRDRFFKRGGVNSHRPFRSLRGFERNRDVTLLDGIHLT
jgi:hypothetical protein